MKELALLFSTILCAFTPAIGQKWTRVSASTLLANRVALGAAEVTGTSVERFDVIACGAKGDGHTDDSAAIQSCANQAASSGPILFPPGRYLIKSASVVFTRAHVFPKLIGEGYGVWDTPQIILDCSLHGPAFQFNDGISGMAVRGLTFLSNCSGPPSSGQNGIDYLAHTSRDTGVVPSLIENCFFQHLWNGVYAPYGSSLTLNGDYFLVNANDGVFLGEGMTNTWLSQVNLLGNANAGLEGSGNQALWMSDVQCWGGGYCYKFTKDARQFFWSNVVADSMNDTGFYFDNAGLGKCMGCWSCGSKSGWGAQFLHRSNNFTWLAGEIGDNNKGGVELGGPSTAGSGSYGLEFASGLRLSGNGNGSGYGFVADPGASGFVIKDVYCGPYGLDPDHQLACLYVSAAGPYGPSSNWRFERPIQMSQTKPLLIDKSPGSAGGYKVLDLPGILAYAIAQGTVAAGSTSTIDLSSFLPTPTQLAALVDATFMMTAGNSGSDVGAIVRVIKTRDGCSGSFMANIPGMGSGSLSISGCVVTVTNTSADASISYQVYESKEEPFMLGSF